MNKDEIVGLLIEYRDSINSKDRDEIFTMTGSIDSVITNYLPTSNALKSDLEYSRKNIVMLVGLKRDNGLHGITLDNQKDFLRKYLETLITQISKIGIPEHKNQVDNSINLNVSQNQSQEQQQSQKIVLDIFVESIKDEISGKQFKELKAIIVEEKEPEKAKSKIIEKAKSFGSDICSNIIANIITNPNIWQGLI